MSFYKYCRFLLLILLFILVNQVNAELYQNQFASIMMGKKKIGQVHFITKHDDNGVLQELSTRSSLSKVKGKRVVVVLDPQWLHTFF
jgi:hypothetical protein